MSADHLHVSSEIQTLQKVIVHRRSQNEETIIALDSTEFTRVRGGSHCITYPISRQ